MISKIKFQFSNFSRRKMLFVFAAFLLSACLLHTSAHAQRRDHLTPMEVELVRDAQQIDLRMKVFVKAIDRRFIALNKDATQAKQIEKDAELWGELPTGTRQQLLLDIERLLDEAINKIDDVAAREMKGDFFPSAVHILADGAKKFLPQLKTELDRAADDKERGAVLGAIEFCNQIIEASAKVKNESPKEIKKRKEKADKEQKKDSD